MVTREDIVVEVEKVPEEHLEELYRIIKDFEEKGSECEPHQNVMSALREVKISASPDFSIKANLCDLEKENAR